MNLYGKGMADGTFPEQLNPRGGCFGKPCIYESLGVDNTRFFKSHQVSDIHNSMSFLKDIIKTPLGQSPLKGHLATFKPWSHTTTGPGIRSLMATARRFTVSRTGASPYTFSSFYGSLGRS